MSKRRSHASKWICFNSFPLKIRHKGEIILNIPSVASTHASAPLPRRRHPLHPPFEFPRARPSKLLLLPPSSSSLVERCQNICSAFEVIKSRSNERRRKRRCFLNVSSAHCYGRMAGGRRWCWREWQIFLSLTSLSFVFVLCTNVLTDPNLEAMKHILNSLNLPALSRGKRVFHTS